jgi:hypothetical protein
VPDEAVEEERDAAAPPAPSFVFSPEAIASNRNVDGLKFSVASWTLP